MAKKNSVFFNQYFTQNTHTLYHFKQLKTTQIELIQYNVGSGESSNTVYTYYIKVICGL